MYTIFENPGILDIKALTIMGLNVKENDNPIGYFGTGFKYGVAVATRFNCDVIIQDGSGQVGKKIARRTELFRGAEFDSLFLGDIQLPFTTDLGKNWSLWQAYREFRGNCDDENGLIYASTTLPLSEVSITRIIVSGDSFTEVHDNRGEYFWDPNNQQALGGGNSRSYERPGYIFYKGIRVSEIFEKTDWSYNIVDRQLELSEDRELTSMGHWNVKNCLRHLIMNSKDENLIEEFITERDPINFECLAFTLPDEDSTFTQVAMRVFHTKRDKLQGQLVDQIRNKLKLTTEYEALQLTETDLREIEGAKKLVGLTDMDLDKVDIVWKADIGEGNLGLYHKNKVYIGKRAFDDGRLVIAATLIEEYIHAVDDMDDYSREFQDKVLRMLVTVLDGLLYHKDKNAYHNTGSPPSSNEIPF